MGLIEGDARPEVPASRRSLALGKNSDVLLGSDDAGSLTVNGIVRGLGAPLASAAALATPTSSVHHVTGNVAITSIVGNGLAGQEVTLIFDGTPTFTDGGNLKLAGNLVATADDTITLKSDGVNWYEVGRSVN
jgi:hypothetical protein